MNTKSIEILDESVSAPTPTPELLANNTSCVQPNNGIVSASVVIDGEPTTLNYTFSWFAGDANGPTNTNDTLKVGDRMRELSAGYYYVSVQDQITGCISDFAQVLVEDDLIDPEFTFYTEPSACDFPTGLAEITITNSAVIADVTWVMIADADGNSMDSLYIGTGGGVYDLEPGTYYANVTTFEGCELGAEAIVETEISGYNLLTDYNQGEKSNDYFHIDCISTFPDNNVKIFNRNGNLVYEADGYDNNTVKFTGKGENGLYMLGTKLPNGTYFYVVDKGDGSKLVSGYIELLR